MSREKREYRVQSTEYRARNIIAMLMLSIFIFSGTSCAQQSTNNEQRTTNDDLVYLKADKVTVSGFDETADWAPKPDPMAVIDGDMSTRWASGYKDNEWVCLDFGRPKTVSKMIIKWEAAYATKFEILSSDDGKAWKTVILLEGQKGGMSEIVFQPVTARYIKLVGLERANAEWGISIWEIEPYGPKDKNPGDLPIGEVFGKKEKTEIEKKRDSIKFDPDDIVMSPGAVTTKEFQRGVNYTSWSAEELKGEMSDFSLIYLSQLGVGHIALMVVYYQDDATAKKIYADPKKTINDESLAHAVNMIHALGMKVMLKPHVDLADDEARVNIIPSDEWFASYKDMILHFARFAAKYNVELLCIGTELSNTTTSRWKDKWLDIINSIRKVYNGPITYAANWDEYDSVSFWNDVDYIGMDAYFPLTKQDNPPLEELVKAWTRNADILEKWLNDNKLEKPIIFTEIGYDTVIGSNQQPWRILPTLSTYVECQDEQ